MNPLSQPPMWPQWSYHHRDPNSCSPVFVKVKLVNSRRNVKIKYGLGNTIVQGQLQMWIPRPNVQAIVLAQWPLSRTLRIDGVDGSHYSGWSGLCLVPQPWEISITGILPGV